MMINPSLHWSIQVEYGMFRNSKRLSILYLHDNRISKIDSNAFDTLKQLTEVRLHSNRLTSFNQVGDFLSFFSSIDNWSKQNSKIFNYYPSFLFRYL